MYRPTFPVWNMWVCRYLAKTSILCSEKISTSPPQRDCSKRLCKTWIFSTRSLTVQMAATQIISLSPPSRDFFEKLFWCYNVMYLLTFDIFFCNPFCASASNWFVPSSLVVEPSPLQNLMTLPFLLVPPGSHVLPAPCSC